MKILFIGDIVAKPGRKTVAKVLPQIIENDNIDVVIANAENLAHGRGFTEKTILEMQKAGVDFFTGGDHIFWQKDSEKLFNSLPVIRPANYPGKTPGKGYSIYKTKTDKNILIINIMGRTSFSSINSYLTDPFTKVDEILNEVDLKNIDYSIVDFHAEATSEKQALAFYLDGRVDAVVGTHTHVPTCDNHVLPKGTLYVTDIGMTGNIDSVLGVEKQIIIDLCLSGRNQKFEWEEKGRTAFRSVLIDTKENSITRLDKENN